MSGGNERTSTEISKPPAPKPESSKPPFSDKVLKALGKAGFAAGTIVDAVITPIGEKTQVVAENIANTIANTIDDISTPPSTPVTKPESSAPRLSEEALKVFKEATVTAGTIVVAAFTPSPPPKPPSSKAR